MHADMPIKFLQPPRGHGAEWQDVQGLYADVKCLLLALSSISDNTVFACAGFAQDDEECDEEEEAMDRYAPSQAGRAVAGLQHTSSHHRAPRPPTSSDTGTTNDTDDWHKSRSLFNVVWSDQDDAQDSGRPPAGRAQRTSSLRSDRSLRRAGSANNV